MFHYQFPKIKHIDDVKWAIADCDEIIIAERDHFDVVNYIVQTDTTFPEICGDLKRDVEKAAIRRECRGLIFDKQGNLISRPFQKFFNVNEREETQVQHIDFSKPHRILEKLDGCLSGSTRILVRNKHTDIEYELTFDEFQHLDYSEYQVYSFNEKTNECEYCDIKNLLVMDGDKKWVSFEFSGNIIECTEDHEFLTTVGWVEAKNLAGKELISD